MIPEDNKQYLLDTVIDLYAQGNLTDGQLDEKLGLLEESSTRGELESFIKGLEEYDTAGRLKQYVLGEGMQVLKGKSSVVKKKGHGSKQAYHLFS